MGSLDRRDDVDEDDVVRQILWRFSFALWDWTTHIGDIGKAIAFLLCLMLSCIAGGIATLSLILAAQAGLEFSAVAVQEEPNFS